MRETIRPNTGIEQPQDATSWLTAIVSSSTDAIVGKTSEGVVTSFNPAAERLFGYRAEEIIGEPVRILIPADRQKEEDSILARIAAGELLEQHDTIRLHKSGSLIDVSISVSPIRDGGGRIIGAAKIARGISGRKRAEKALRESEKRYRRLVEVMPAAMYTIDAEGRITFYNEQAAVIWGRRPKLGDPDERFCGSLRLRRPDGTLLPHSETPMAEALASGASCHAAEVIVERPDGARVPVVASIDPIRDGAGRITGAVNVFVDITERKRTEVRLAADLAALRRLHTLSARTLQAEGMAPLLQEVMDAAVAIVAADCGTLQLLEGESLRIVAHRGHQPAFLEYFADAKKRASVCSVALARGERVVVPDVETSDLFADTPSLPVLRAARVRAIQSTPMETRDGKLVGVLTTQWNKPYFPDQRDLWRIDLLSRQAADLIENVCAKEALRESEERLRLALEAGCMATWDWHIPTGAVQWNEEHYRMLGYEPGEVKPGYETWAARVLPEDFAATEGLLLRTMEHGGDYQTEFRALGKKDQISWLEARGRFERDNEGRCIRSYGVMMDITERKRAEEALRESEARLQAVLDGSLDPIFMKDREGRMVLANPATCAAIGKPAEFCLGKTDEQFLDNPTDARTIMANDRRIMLSGEPETVEEAVSTSSGIRYYVNKKVARRDAAGNVIGLISTARDVTEQKRTEEALRESERRERERRQELETLLAVIPVGVFIAEDKDCAQITANPAGYKLHRIPESANASKSATEDGPSNFGTYSATGEALAPDQLPMQRAAATGESIEGFEHELRFSDGGHKHLLGNALPLFDAAGEVRGAVGAFVDITERRHQEERISALAAFNEGALRSLGEGVYTIDCQGLVTSMNPAAEELFGWTFAELRGKKMHDMTHHHYRDGRPFPACECAGFQVLTHEKPLKNHEDVFIHKSGAFFDVIYTITPLRDLGGKIMGLIVVFSDISKRKKREAQVQLLLREVNHRAKNMLTVVQSVARQTAAANPKEFLERFSERVQALATSQDLLVKTEWRGVEVGELVRGQLAHFRDLTGSRIELKGPSLLVSASAAQTLGMAIHELTTNAGKYGALSVAEGRVAIDWNLERDGAGGETFTISWREQGGPPVSPPSRNGFGSTVIGVLAESSLDAKVDLDFLKTGLSWRLHCPAANIIEGTRLPSAVRSGSHAPGGSRPKVLVVEDEALVAMEIAHVLRKADFEVLGPARAVAQALSLIEEHGCDAAVLDINLSHETSEPIARKLLANGTRFVTLSGYSRTQHPPIFDGVPALPKPFQAALLVAEIKRCLASKKNRQGEFPG